MDNPKSARHAGGGHAGSGLRLGGNNRPGKGACSLGPHGLVFGAEWEPVSGQQGQVSRRELGLRAHGAQLEHEPPGREEELVMSHPQESERLLMNFQRKVSA